MSDQSQREGQTGLALQIAYQLYEHGESLVQARMQSFLFMMTVLLLCWATLYSSSFKPRIILFVLSLAGFLLSASFAVWGRRADKFMGLYRDRILFLERDLPDTLKMMHPIAELQEHGEATRPFKQDKVKFNWFEKHVRAGVILVGASGILGTISLFLMFLSLRG